MSCRALRAFLRLMTAVFMESGLFGAQAADSGTCFEADAAPNIPIMMQSPPPQPGSDSYRFYPASAFVTMNVRALETTFTVKPVYFFQWANHGPRKVAKGNLGPNITQLSETQLNFSSIAKADACTLAQTAIVLGQNALAQRYASEANLRIEINAAPAHLTDVCVVWDRPLPPKTSGIMLDYEVQDGRSPSYTLEFLDKYAKLVQAAGKRVFLYTNPLDAPTQKKTGINGDNATAIANVYNGISILLWSGNKQSSIEKSYAEQRSFIKLVDPAKIFIVFELKNTSIEDAVAVRRLAQRDNVYAVMFWRNDEKQGGSCDRPINQKIGCVAFGRC